MSSGRIHLIPVPLSGASILQLSEDGNHAAAQIQHFLVERAKSARAFLKSIHHPTRMNEIHILEWSPTIIMELWQEILQILKEGKDVGILSEAGLPAVADPGGDIVQLAHLEGIQVIPHSGPSAIFLALMASGLGGQQFQFHGYLPSKRELVRNELIKIGQNAIKTDVTQIFMETPYRNKQIFEVGLSVLSSKLLLCVAAGIGSSDERISTKTVQSWKESDYTLFFGIPAIFLLSK
ncbi:MAG: SAM-dependent methyltransferase [Bacteroidota bacterium]|nr:SAM-dependent methyltransferase [Bacteroidota bacterium]